MGLLGRKSCHLFDNHYLYLCFVLHAPLSLLWYLPPVQTDNHSDKPPLSKWNPLLISQGTLGKRRWYKILRTDHEGVECCGGGQELRGHCWFTHKLNPGDQMLLTPTPDFWNDILPIIPTLGAVSRTYPWESKMLASIWIAYMTLTQLSYPAKVLRLTGECRDLLKTSLISKFLCLLKQRI